MAHSPEKKDENEQGQQSPLKSKTPLVDNFSTSFKSIIEKDIESGLKYFNRESELNVLLKALLKKEKQHIAIIGEPGTGKETLIKMAAYKILKGETSILLGSLNFIELEFDSLISGAKYRGQLEERLQAINNEIEKADNFVIIIKNIEGFAESPYFLGLLRSKAKIITIFDSEKAEVFFKKYSSFFKLFNIIKINPTNKADTVQVLKSHIEKFQKYFSVIINGKFIEDVIEYSNLYLPDELQPQKSLSILEEVCATVELNRLSNPKDILHNLKNEFDRINNEIEKINIEKNNIVKLQKYEEAATLRNLKVKLLDEQVKLKLKIKKTSKENRVIVTEEDLINAIHNQTGIDKEKIKKKEKLIIKTKQSLRAEYSGLPQFEFLQTQSILHGHQISIKGGVAFILIPHNKEFDDLFYHYIKPSMEVHGLTVLKADNIFKPGNILSQVWAQIRTAEVIVVDVSGQNSNVIFELGLCYGIQRCPILLTRDPSELPFNIRNLRYIQYENTAAGAHKLAEDLKTTVGEFLSAVRTDSL
jgi:ATP-dependent Clp protease ATP-binding subunit ClpA